MFDVFYLTTAPGLFPHEWRADSIDHARQLSRTRYLWIVDSANDYSGFDWSWEPKPWEAHQAHVWPSQHQENGGTWLIPRQGYTDVNRHHPQVIKCRTVPRIHIKHTPSSDNAGDINTRYIADYLGTMRRALSQVAWEYCWVTADVCDYTDFDFTWHPSEWQQQLLHVFASNDQKFGDTFYVHVPTFLKQSQDLKVLEWYDGLNFVESPNVPRLPMPSVQYTGDSIVDAIWQHEFDTPLVQFYQDLELPDPPTVSLWQEKTKTVVPLSRGHATAVIPRECKNHLKTQVYDYPYINKDHKYLLETPLDIVFISNGEFNAEVNWENLNWSHSGMHRNRIRRVDGVNGRAEAYHAAARASNTAWFFAVFAKLWVRSGFDWSWQPDRFQEPKHYIFHARNPVNGLVYGHQAMIAYNRDLVLANPGTGLDFTLDSPHEVVPIESGTAEYAHTPWMAWRTAFREALKLRASLPDIDNEYRLQQWTTQDNTPGQWSLRGACDAVEYYDSVGGDFDALKKSYEWSWLASYALMKHGLVPD